ncbi:hypothetical protein A5672_26460 [Mycobacterium alsense]|uniref:PE domain-containing protein n=2 Tax=Mycobacterium alsense TaxID=324058 RepID=A0ABD6NW47_9MYCO|nr:hypothetical protein A5672_26460 [Mycobacterium alsense]OBJ02769.1 hypothetical protein A5660_21100 [Mycobacterium alsense]
MSYVMAAPEMLATAAADVAAIGSAVSGAHAAAAVPTVGVLPAAADEVSASVAQFFSGVAQEFHSLVGQAAAFGEQFAQHLNLGAGSYAAAEAVNGASLTSAESIVDIVNGLAAPYINQITSMVNTVTFILQKVMSAIQLAFLVPYEALVLAYLTLALMIGAIQLLTAYLGISIPIP